MLSKKNLHFILQTWHKIFHSFIVCVPRMRCANYGAMKNCCLTVFMVIALFFSSSFSVFAQENPSSAHTVTYSGTRNINNNTGAYRSVGFCGYFNFNDFYSILVSRGNGDPILNDTFYLTDFQFILVSPNGHENICDTFLFRTWATPSDLPSYPRVYFPYQGVPDFFKNNVFNYTSGSTQSFKFNNVDPDDVSFHFCTNKTFWSVNNGFSDTRNVRFKATFKVYYMNSINDIYSKLVDIEGGIDSGFINIENSISDQTNSIKNSISNQTNSINSNQNTNTQKILDQNSQFRQEDRQEAQSVGTIAQDFLTQNTAKVKSNFNILWEPIAFTQRVISVFSGGTKSSLYARRYDGVVGFVYNEETGCLDPVIDTGPRARYGKASSGTTITFPAYTLPVLNLKLWDSYTFDVATVKSAFPVLFNAIYVFSGVLCLYWFLGFLSDKFQEVFKE